MIKVNIKIIEDIILWYIESVFPLVMKNKIHAGIFDQFDKTVALELNKESVCVDIMMLHIEELITKYEWINKYVKLIDFYYFFATYDSIAKSINKQKSRKEISLQLRKYYEKYANDYIDDVLDSHLPSLDNKDKRLYEICSSKTKFKKFLCVIKNRIDALNNIVIDRFDYDKVLGNNKLRAQLVQYLNIKVCPYCNRQYINPVTLNHKTTYLGDIDHILPKSKYALFQLSFYNMIPVCKVCNQLFKKDRTDIVLNPYFEGFDDDCFLEMKFNSVRELIGLEKPSNYSWTINLNPVIYNNGDEFQLNNKITKIRNNIRVFNLNKVYKSNGSEFQRILKIKYIYESHAFRHNVNAILNHDKKAIFDQMDEQLIYGVSLDKNKFQDEILSKAIYDIVLFN